MNKIFLALKYWWIGSERKKGKENGS
jgi:hypothetical protein